ncbi:MAG: hypothetical protein E7C86_04125 [Paeniclostridium sordellii]|nr:hypothetical protein [Paeniclostridium sordellii]
MINKYVVREKTIRIADKSEIKFPVLMEQFILPNKQVIELPSVLNKYAYNKYKNKPISVAKNINSTIAQFFNYLKEQIVLGEDEAFNILKEKKINGLTFYHLAEFLKYSIDICDNSYSTIKQKERRLLNFYKYLSSANLIDVKWTYRMVFSSEEGKRQRIYDYPLDNIEYNVPYPPKKKDYTKIVDLSDDDIYLLLDICEKYTPDILFAVALCMYGGLRKGEVVNLRVRDLRLFNDENIMVADIKDRPQLFIGRPLSESGVKKPRQQVVFNDNGQLYRYYEKQINYRLKTLSKNNTETQALFVDTNGNSLTGMNYVNRFNKLKKLFLKAKELDEYSEFLRLSEGKWGSHICRGIFTNLCVRRGYARSLDELKGYRGDSNKLSSEPYWNKYTLEVQTQRTLDVITSCAKYKSKIY